MTAVGIDVGKATWDVAIDGVPMKTPEQRGLQWLGGLRRHQKAECAAAVNLLRGAVREV